MAQITLGGTPCNTLGSLPETGSNAPNFDLVKDDLSPFALSTAAGKRLVLNIFPSVDTGVCATSTRKFNGYASGLENTVVACVSMDLPFAMKRFCGAEGLEDVVMLSGFRNSDFGKDYGVTIADGGFAGLYSRAVVVIDGDGTVLYTEQVSEVGNEPNYDAALAALS